MRSRRSVNDQVAEVARRRLELLSAELAEIRPDPVDTPVLRKRGTPVTRLTDLNRDGFPDLVADFDEREMMNRGDLPAGSPVLVLLGQMRGGAHLRGADVVVAQ